MAMPRGRRRHEPVRQPQDWRDDWGAPAAASRVWQRPWRSPAAAARIRQWSATTARCAAATSAAGDAASSTAASAGDATTGDAASTATRHAAAATTTRSATTTRLGGPLLMHRRGADRTASWSFSPVFESLVQLHPLRRHDCVWIRSESSQAQVSDLVPGEEVYTPY